MCLSIEVRDEWMQRAVVWAARRVRYTINRARMNERGPAEKMDDAVMGEIASAAVAQYLDDERGQLVLAYDDVRTDEYRDPDPGWDLACGASLEGWPGPADDPRTPAAGALTFSVKSSRIPERYGDRLADAVAACDFKVLKHSESIEEDLTSDFETQVYYELATSRFRPGLLTTMAEIEALDVDAIIGGLQLKDRYSRCTLVGFASRQRIAAHSRQLARAGPPSSWLSNHAGHAKPMWIAPLTLARLPRRLGVAE